MTEYPRYHVVVVSKYIGHYRATDPRAWMIADRDHANSCIGRKYDDRALAQAEADRLNDGQTAAEEERS